MREITEYHSVKKATIGDLVWKYYLCSLTGPYIIVGYDNDQQAWILSDSQKTVGAFTHCLRVPIQRWIDDE